ncbi:hypothetical protein H6G89_33205 [Oscillatoria sp. FACHB-1407]|uniref:hypothetical protein n=1 Tax=Oscillatoria sp. FACHB-1407 TaxID=2692847 RepID=UPI0016876616|nr:hypothetical protein [Oscillatoria sp. FACHB-1407]MBD2465849.1 hypothetical protein [Oscillatoria sp. FACHB-1407]
MFAKTLTSINPKCLINVLIPASALMVSSLVTHSAIASDLSRGCASLGGTYHALAEGQSICLYKTPNHNGSLGLYCDQNQQCDRLVYTTRPDGSQTLEFVPVEPREQIDD